MHILVCSGLSWWWEETRALTYLSLPASLEYKLQDAENASNKFAIVFPEPAGCSTEDRCQKHSYKLVPLHSYNGQLCMRRKCLTIYIQMQTVELGGRSGYQIASKPKGAAIFLKKSFLLRVGRFI